MTKRLLAAIREAFNRCPDCGAKADDTNFVRSICACGAMHNCCDRCGFAYDCPLDEDD